MRLRLALCAALLATAPLHAQDARAVGVSAAELRAILALATETDARWNARDAAGLSALYAAEGDNRIVGTPVDLRGRDAIRAYFARSLPRSEAALRHRTVVDEVQRVSPDVAVVEGRVWIERLAPDSTRTVERAFTMDAIVVRDGDVWRVRWNRARPTAAVASASP